MNCDLEQCSAPGNHREVSVGESNSKTYQNLCVGEPGQ